MDGLFSRRAGTYEQENAWILSPAFIEPLVPAVFGGGAMLDVGTGTGVVAEYAHSIGWTVSALDANEEMLKNVSADISVVLGDAHHLPFPDRSFDLVTCRQSIQYLDFGSAIGEMLRVSRGQVRLLHAFISREDIALWQHLFALAQGPNRRFFSYDMLNEVIDRFPHGGMDYSFQKSRERFLKPGHACAAIDSFLLDHPDFVDRYRVENLEDRFYYDLKWVLQVICVPSVDI